MLKISTVLTFLILSSLLGAQTYSEDELVEAELEETVSLENVLEIYANELENQEDYENDRRYLEEDDFYYEEEI